MKERLERHPRINLPAASRSAVSALRSRMVSLAKPFKKNSAVRFSPKVISRQPHRSLFYSQYLLPICAINTFQLVRNRLLFLFRHLRVPIVLRWPIMRISGTMALHRPSEIMPVHLSVGIAISLGLCHRLLQVLFVRFTNDRNRLLKRLDSLCSWSFIIFVVHQLHPFVAVVRSSFGSSHWKYKPIEQ